MDYETPSRAARHVFRVVILSRLLEGEELERMEKVGEDHVQLCTTFLER